MVGFFFGKHSKSQQLLVTLHRISGAGVPCSLLIGTDAAFHQQPEVNYLPRFSPQLISLEE
jgi:hypothetical protein